MSTTGNPGCDAEGLLSPSLRPIEERDDAAMARLIRQVMSEFGAVGPGFSIGDPEVDWMSQAYNAAGHAYWVVEQHGEILAGAGIAPLHGGPPHVCELRKMYALSKARGLGLGHRLLERCLAAARHMGYRRCYLESLGHLEGALKLYQQNGFSKLDGPLGSTGHCGCNTWMILEL